MPCLLLEDGFLRSLRRGDSPLSLIVDDIGIYYDASGPSRLEQLIAQPCPQDQAERVRALIAAWQASGVSKYNHAPEYTGPLPEHYVLVVDQTFGDAAIACGQANAASFGQMLDAALSENPQCTVLVKVHPDVFTHGKTGYFDVDRLTADPRVRVIAEECHAVRLITEAEAIYVVTSQMGFEGLLWGKRVRCFGMPFYAGWGLTEDELPPPMRRSHISLEQLVHAALIAAARYVNPETGERWEVEHALSFISVGRRRLQAEWNANGFKASSPGLWQRFKKFISVRRRVS